MKDPTEWARWHANESGFESLNKFLLGNATFEEAAIDVMEELLENHMKDLSGDLADAEYEIDALKTRVHNLQDELAGIRSEYQSDISNLRERYIRSGEDPNVILREFLETHMDR